MISIPIISTYNAKGVKQAQKSFNGFDKSINKLGTSLASVFAVRKVIAFGEASVKAFVADDKAARSLAKTLDNIGIAYLSTNVEKFIANLQRTTGILDDDLRPAFQTLVTATGDVETSQNALATALDISAGTGKDVKTVSAALAKAYLGQTTSLTKLGVGLSKATLKTGDMEQIMSELNKKFSGQALTAMDSYAGKMAKIEVASANVKEILGKGILDALLVLSDNPNVDELATSLENAATAAADLLRSLSKITKMAMDPIVTGVNAYVELLQLITPMTEFILNADPTYLMHNGKYPTSKTSTKPSRFPMASPAENRSNAAKVKINNDKIAKAKADELKLLKDKNTQTLLDAKMKKDQAALDELKKRFDLERIGLNVALGKATDETTRKTILAQIALLDATGSTAQKAMDELDKAQAEKLANELKAALALEKLAAAADGVFTIFTTKVPFIGDVQGPGLKPKIEMPSQAEKDAVEADRLAEIAKREADRIKGLKPKIDPKLPFVPDPSLSDYFNKDYSSNTGSNTISLPSMGTGSTTTGNVYIDNSIHVGEGGTVVDPTTVTEIVRSAVQQNNRYGSSMQYAGNIAV